MKKKKNLEQDYQTFVKIKENTEKELREQNAIEQESEMNIN